MVEYTLFLLPLIVSVSIVILALTFTVPPAFRLFRKLVRKFRSPKSAQQQPLLVDEDEDEDGLVEAPPVRYMPSQGFQSDFRAHIRSLREYGTVLFWMELSRALCMAALLGLSIYAAVLAEPPDKISLFGMDGGMEALKYHQGAKKHNKNKSTAGNYSVLELGEFGACAFYVRSFCLGVMGRC
jgi:hypothetical protein